MNYLPMKATLLDYMGSDKTVVDAARVSMAKFSELGFGQGPTDDSDAGLIEYLATGMQSAMRKKLAERIAAGCSLDEAAALIEEIRSIATHWTPFGHCTATFHLRAPIFVNRQITRSTVGLVENEESRRYVSDEPNFWRPHRWRMKAKNKKQGSGADFDAPMQGNLFDLHNGIVGTCLIGYSRFIDMDVAPEQARMVLPLCTHTEWVWTGTLFAWARVAGLRLAPDTQAETREIAMQISEALIKLYPLSWRALVRYAR